MERSLTLDRPTIALGVFGMVGLTIIGIGIGLLMSDDGSVTLPVVVEAEPARFNDPNVEPHFWGDEDRSGISSVRLATNLPIEADAEITQSTTQMVEEGTLQNTTIVFDSVRTVAENYALYNEKLGADGWTVVNTHNTDALGALYATRGEDAVNVTIVAGDPTNPVVRSQVSISELIAAL